MAVRVIATKLTIDNEAQFKKEMAAVNSNLKTLRSEMALVDAEFRGQANSVEALSEKDRILRDQVAQAAQKVQELEKALQQAGEVFKDNPRKIDEYQRALNNAQRDLIDLNEALQDNSKYLDEAKKSADGCASSIDGFGNEVNNAGEGFKNPIAQLDGFIGKLGGLKGAIVGSAIVGGLKEIADGIVSIVDGSQEFREIMGTLEASSAAAGYTAEETAATFEQLYSVLGDTQAAATATANLQALGLSQEELAYMTDLVIGAWATYGDSIPIDSLAESVNETIKAGQVTGVFADALNWAGQSEDAFNAALQATSSEAERANLVMATLAQQGLAETAEAWRQNNQDIMAANDSQLRFEQAQAALGEKLQPVRNGLRDMGTAGFLFMAECIDSAIQALQALENWWSRIREAWTELTSSSVNLTPGAIEGTINGSHATGLDRVPFDGYVAELHRDEAVLTANEAAVWRTIRQESAPAQTSEQAIQAAARTASRETAEALAAELSKARSTGGAGPIQIEVRLGDEVIDRKIIPRINAEQRRLGTDSLRR